MFRSVRIEKYEVQHPVRKAADRGDSLLMDDDYLLASTLRVDGLGRAKR